MKTKCLYCNKIFTAKTSRAKYCSRKCCFTDYNKKKAIRLKVDNYREMTCAYCNKVIITDNLQRLYCSKKCKYDSWYKRNYENTIKFAGKNIKDNCELCNKEFVKTDSRKRFCSEECRVIVSSKRNYPPINTKREKGSEANLLWRERLRNKHIGKYSKIGKNETLLLNIVETILNIKLERQYYCAGYFVDGYDIHNNIVYEIDEFFHYLKNEELRPKDLLRQKRITGALKCNFIRIKDVNENKIKRKTKKLINTIRLQLERNKKWRKKK